MGILVGDKYLAKATARNVMNGITAQDDIRTGFVDSSLVTIHVIRKDGNTRQMAVALEAFNNNFVNDRFHLAPPNRGYALVRHATTLYK